MSGFTDMEDAFIELLREIAPIGTHVPENLTEFIAVNRIGGSTDSLGLFDNAVMVVDCYCPNNRARQKGMVREVRSILAGREGVLTSAGLVDRIWETDAAQLLPYDNADVRFITSTWGASSRLQTDL